MVASPSRSSRASLKSAEVSGRHTYEAVISCASPFRFQSPVVRGGSRPKMPAISVVIPTRNRAAWLVQAVESVLAQTFQDIEIILALNSADSETHAASDRLNADPRVRSVRTNDSTASAARNRGIELAASDWIALLDDDDLWLPNKLE